MQEELKYGSGIHAGETLEPDLSDHSMLLTYGNTCTNSIKQEQWSLNKKKKNIATLHTETNELLHMRDRVKKVVKDGKSRDLSFQCQTGVGQTPGSTCLFSQHHQPVRGCASTHEVASEARNKLLWVMTCTVKHSVCSSVVEGLMITMQNNLLTGGRPESAAAVTQFPKAAEPETA